MTGEMVVECRRKHYEHCRRMKSFLGNMFLVFAERGDKLRLQYCGKQLCKRKFMMLWGLGQRVYDDARTMWKNGVTHKSHGLLGYLRPNSVRAWVHSALMVILQAEAEVIADGKWHLHDTMKARELHYAVMEEWKDPTFTKEPSFGGAPTEECVKFVLRKYFPFVKWFRDGEYGQCHVCKEHSDLFKAGFPSEEARAAYEVDKRIHSKIHRVNRYVVSVSLFP